MLPTFDVSFLPALVWLIAAWFLAMIVRLLIATIAARLAGFRIVACGIGTGRVLARVRLGGIVFVLGPNLLRSLLVAVSEALRPSRAALVTAALGELSASLLIAVGMILAWSSGLRHSLIPALFFVSIGSLLSQLVPIRLRLKNGIHYKTIGMLLIQLANRSNFSDVWPGPSLALGHLMRKFCREIDAPLGTVHYTLLLAIDQAALGDVEAARETLGDTCLDDLRRGNFGAAKEAYARAVLAVAEHAIDVDARIVKAIERCENDTTALACLSLLLARSTHQAGHPAAELAQAAVEDAEASYYPDLVTAARMFLLTVAPTESLKKDTDGLLSLRGAAEARPVAKLRFLVALVTEFASRGQFDETRQYFTQAQPLLVAIAREIPNAQTRAIYLAQEGRHLRDVIVKHDPEVPLFLPIGPTARKAIPAV